MTVVRMPSKNHSARVDTSRQCCDGRCFQANPSQGGSCPVIDRVVPIARPGPDIVDRAIDAVYWIAGIVMLAALLMGGMEAPL